MGWYEALKDATAAAEKLRNAELNQLLANVKMECAHLAEETARLREDNLKLREAASLREKMHFRDNVYWQRTGQEEIGPFCPKCWPADRNDVPMLDEGPDGKTWSCPVCDKWVLKPGHSLYEGLDRPRRPPTPDFGET
jgi:hypothetical protein